MTYIYMYIYIYTYIYIHVHMYMYICRAHRDGGSSQGGTRHSMPPARRRGGFNLND